MSKKVVKIIKIRRSNDLNFRNFMWKTKYCTEKLAGQMNFYYQLIEGMKVPNLDLAQT